jgi:hypothetical protein
MGQWYYGNASYFTSCPVGHDCCDGFWDIAYGYLWTDQSCGKLPKRKCDQYITIKDLCTYKSITLPISTQCSCAAEIGCSAQMRCNGQLLSYRSSPILDLTDDLFLYLHGNLTDGRVPFAVYT